MNFSMFFYNLLSTDANTALFPIAWVRGNSYMMFSRKHGVIIGVSAFSPWWRCRDTFVTACSCPRSGWFVAFCSYTDNNVPTHLCSQASPCLYLNVRIIHPQSTCSKESRSSHLHHSSTVYLPLEPSNCCIAPIVSPNVRT